VPELPRAAHSRSTPLIAMKAPCKNTVPGGSVTSANASAVSRSGRARSILEPFATSARYCNSVGGLHMKKVDEYLQHAAECREMARVSSLAHHRQQLEEMAKTWEQLAEVRGREIQKRSEA